MNSGELQLVTEVQAARMLAVSVAALRRWRREGRGPNFTHCERCVRYDLRSIERFLEQNSSANKKTADSRSAAKREVRNAHATTQG
jgi:predicted site-specific integrase-resolvase